MELWKNAFLWVVKTLHHQKVKPKTERVQARETFVAPLDRASQLTNRWARERDCVCVCVCVCAREGVGAVKVILV